MPSRIGPLKGQIYKQLIIIFLLSMLTVKKLQASFKIGVTLPNQKGRNSGNLLDNMRIVMLKSCILIVCY